MVTSLQRALLLRLLGALVLLTAPGSLSAGACCAGATSTIPIRLGECEKVLVGVGISAENSWGFWDDSGDLHTSSMQDQALVSSVAAAWRWNRFGQVGISMPARLNYREAGSLMELGGGAGDLVASVMLSPLEEGTAGPGGLSLPRVYVTLGGRAPTGTSLEKTQTQLMSDVTGQPGFSAQAGLSVERALGKWPWSLSLDADVPLMTELPVKLTAGAGFGRYVGLHWSILASLRNTFSLESDADHPMSATKLGLRVVRGQRLAWRAWVGAEADLPLDNAGKSAYLVASLAAGVTFIR